MTWSASPSFSGAPRPVDELGCEFRQSAKRFLGVSILHEQSLTLDVAQVAESQAERIDSGLCIRRRIAGQVPDARRLRFYAASGGRRDQKGYGNDKDYISGCRRHSS